MTDTKSGLKLLIGVALVAGTSPDRHNRPQTVDIHP